MNQRKLMFIMIIIAQLLDVGEFCASLGNSATSQIITNPRFTFTANPPVSWTYYPVTTLASTAVGTPFFPGQSMTQQAAMNRATSDINSAFLSALQSSNYNSAGITLTTTYTPDPISNCYTIATGNSPAYPAVLGQAQGGTMTGTAVLAPVSPATGLECCAPPQYGNGDICQSTVPSIAFTPYLKQITVTTAGSSLALPESTWNTIAAEMLAYLALNSLVGFTTPITVSG